MLVPDAEQRLEPLEGASDLGHVHHAPGDDVAARRRSERGEVASKDLRPGLGRVVGFGLLDGDEPTVGTRVPEGRLVVVHNVCTDARRAPGSPCVHAGEPVRAFEVDHPVRPGHGAGCRERADGRRELPRQLALPREVRLAERGPEERVVAPSDEVQGLPHHRGLEHRPAGELALERFAPEARRPRPDPHVGRLRRLGLHPDQPLDHRRRREPLPLQQELTGEGGAVQLAQREDAVGHAPTLHIAVGRSRRRPSAGDRAIGNSTHSTLRVPPPGQGMC